MSEHTTAPAIDRQGYLPHDWTREAWEALKRSPANAAANRIYDLAVELRDALHTFVETYPERVAAHQIRAAGVAVPAVARAFYLDIPRVHFKGFTYSVEEFIEAIGDVIPELPDDAQGEPATAAAEGVPCAAGGT